MKPADAVRKQQEDWAKGRCFTVDPDGYTSVLSENLFTSMSPGTRVEFARGDGGELGRPGKRGKMQALHSSSALGCNVFEYWRCRDNSILAASLGTNPPLKIEFERKFPTRLPGNAPNLDVVLHPESGPLVAIECKFLEPYGPHTHGFKDKYFENPHGLWATHGYSHCQELARALNSGEDKFEWLYAEQLLKHILGLARLQDAWKLVYLWYEVPGSDGEGHAADAKRFAHVVTADGIDFEALSYQALFSKLRDRTGDEHRAYIDYLENRYFGPQ